MGRENSVEGGAEGEEGRAWHAQGGLQEEGMVKARRRYVWRGKRDGGEGETLILHDSIRRRTAG